MAPEVTIICKRIVFPDVNRNVLQKDKTKEAVFYNDYKDLKENIYKYKKLDRIKHQDFTVMQLYMKNKSSDKCRTKFRLGTDMLAGKF